MTVILECLVLVLYKTTIITQILHRMKMYHGLGKFDVKKFLSLVWHNENWTHEIFLTVNKKVTFLFIEDSKGRKYFTTNKFHTKISNGEFFPNHGNVISTIHQLSVLLGSPNPAVLYVGYWKQFNCGEALKRNAPK